MLIRACDIDKKVPAKNYTITVDDGRSISKDLCAEHGEPFEEWLEEAGPATDPTDLVLDQDWLGAADEAPKEEPAEEEPAPVVPKRPAPKRAAAKKTTARRRPKIVSLEEIEAQKKS
ncbi:hypothetical protein [Streptomyces sp. RK76]|uniref:hypothetical protein n=1 Tax=Streptomyces sp. RK76 TaxID=2824896 RepID=UPI001B376908|nr:hypothetical protein [Streptomyces sp. RK76]MBQ0949258.1 hypothetical protein [Streptomyces sp. RK76]